MVRLVRFKVAPGSECKAQDLADELAPLIAEQPGCRAVTIFGDHGDAEYGIYVLWDTQEHADQAAGLVRPQLEFGDGAVSQPNGTDGGEAHDVGQIGRPLVKEGVEHNRGLGLRRNRSMMNCVFWTFCGA